MDHFSPASEKPATVLLVDDQPANLLALEAILEPLGHRLIKATSGEEALRAVLGEEVALILLDVQMPGMDGFETASLLKARPRTSHIPIIFITALSRDASHVFQGYETGGVDYILKPFNADILRSKVSVFVELYQRGEQIKRQAALLRQRELEEFERKIEYRFRSLTDAMPLCVWATRADGSVYYGNRIWTEYVGGLPEHGVDCVAAVHPDDRESVQHAWKTAIQSERPFELQYRVRRHTDGQYRWMLGRAVPERDERGNLFGWIATATDIDDQKRIEVILERLSAQEQKARQAAEQANKAKDEFLATVSHELRTPLTAILGWSALLKNGLPEPEKQRHAAEVIERNARAQRNLIEDLLDMSRIASGKMKVFPRSVELKPVVNAAVDIVRELAESKRIQLQVELRSSADMVQVDPDRLQQIIWNLVTNAVKFSPPGGAVLVSATFQDDQLQLRVTDQGQGIAPEALAHLFDRFWQADSTSTRTSGGLGLGLAVVRHLVELQGGTVHAESEGLGRGSTFTVELPVRKAAVGGVSEAATISSAPSLQDVKVLLVEDDPDGREAITMMLEEFGAEVHSVGSAEEAYTTLPHLHPDLLVSDVGLPHEDGYSLLRRVRRLPPEEGGQTPAAALSAYATTEDQRRALEAGFQVHVAKPAEPLRLARALEQLAQRGSRGRQSAPDAHSGQEHVDLKHEADTHFRHGAVDHAVLPS